eukprot:3467276-Rhodomonas_salina.1
MVSEKSGWGYAWYGYPGRTLALWLPLDSGNSGVISGKPGTLANSMLSKSQARNSYPGTGTRVPGYGPARLYTCVSVGFTGPGASLRLSTSDSLFQLHPGTRAVSESQWRALWRQDPRSPFRVQVQLVSWTQTDPSAPGLPLTPALSGALLGSCPSH